LDSNIGATRCQIFRLKCTEFDFRWGCTRGRKEKGEKAGEEGREKEKWREEQWQPAMHVGRVDSFSVLRKASDDSEMSAFKQKGLK